MGVPMSVALSPQECEKMRAFLGALVAYARMLPPGVKPNVGAFIQEWRARNGGYVHLRRHKEAREVEGAFEVYRNLEEKHGREKPRAMGSNGAVRSTLDLSVFKFYTNQNTGYYVTVSSGGKISLSPSLAQKFKGFGGKIYLRVGLNPVGTILVMREEEGGLSFYKTSGKDRSYRSSCISLARDLEKAGAKLPARFRMEWDDDLGWWMGRRVE